MTLKGCERLLAHYKATGNKKAELEMQAVLDDLKPQPKKTVSNK